VRTHTTPHAQTDYYRNRCRKDNTCCAHTFIWWPNDLYSLVLPQSASHMIVTDLTYFSIIRLKEIKHIIKPHSQTMSTVTDLCWSSLTDTQSDWSQPANTAYFSYNRLKTALIWDTALFQFMKPLRCINTTII